MDIFDFDFLEDLLASSDDEVSPNPPLNRGSSVTDDSLSSGSPPSSSCISGDTLTTPSTLSASALVFTPRASCSLILPANSSHEEDQGSTPKTFKNGRLRKASMKRRRNCSYCKRKGFDAAMYGSHTLRNPQNDDLMCPTLTSILCDTCGDKTKDKNVHDRSECPMKGFQPLIVPSSYLNCRFNDSFKN